MFVCVSHEGMDTQTNTKHFHLGTENALYSYMTILLNILISLKLVIIICEKFCG